MYKYRRYNYGSSLKKRTYQQYKAAKKGNETLTFVVNSNYCFSARYDRGTEQGTACVNIWDVLARNSNFQALKSMYDQVRIDGVRCTLSVTDAVTSITQIQQIKNITVVTAWDKSGLSPSQYYLFKKQTGVTAGDIINENEWDTEKALSWSTKVGSGIVNSSTANKSILNSFQKWNSYVKIYPQIGQERQQFINTGDIKLFENGIDSNTSLRTINNNYNDQIVNTMLNSSNPVIPFESSAVRFKPCLLVSVFTNAIESNAISSYGNCQPVVFNGEFSISLTFKNLKGSTGLLNDYTVPNGVAVSVESNMEQDAEPATQQQQAQRALMRSTPNGFEVNIPDFTNSPFVSFNENNQPYCTSLTLKFDGATEVTPIQMDGVEKVAQWIDDQQSVTSEATLVNWNEFEDKVENDTVTLTPGSSLVVAMPKKAQASTEEGRNGSRFVNIINDAANSVNKVIEFGEKAKTLTTAASAAAKLIGMGIKIYQNPVGAITEATTNTVKKICGIPTLKLIDYTPSREDPNRAQLNQYYKLTATGLRRVNSLNEEEMRTDDIDELNEEDTVYTYLPDSLFEFRE